MDKPRRNHGPSITLVALPLFAALLLGCAGAPLKVPAPGTGGVRLGGADLPSADFSRAWLAAPSFGEAFLAQGNFHGASLKSASFVDATLAGAHFDGSDLRGALLGRSDLRWAVLDESYLLDAYLYEADLSNSKLRGANLRGAVLVGADLWRADLSESVLLGASLGGADLRLARLCRADLRNADLQGADLRGADLREADLTGADLRGARLDGAMLSRARLGDAWFDLEQLRFAQIEGAVIEKTPALQVKVAAGQIELGETIYFETKKARILPRSHPLLEEVARVLRERPEILRVRIAGHTDSVGERAFNWQLSLDRAHAVREFLIARGVRPARLAAMGFGEERPLWRPDDAPAHRAANRRVTITIEERDMPEW